MKLTKKEYEVLEALEKTSLMDLGPSLDDQKILSVANGVLRRVLDEAGITDGTILRLTLDDDDDIVRLERMLEVWDHALSQMRFAYTKNEDLIGDHWLVDSLLEQIREIEESWD